MRVLICAHDLLLSLSKFMFCIFLLSQNTCTIKLNLIVLLLLFVCLFFFLFFFFFFLFFFLLLLFSSM